MSENPDSGGNVQTPSEAKKEPFIEPLSVKDQTSNASEIHMRGETDGGKKERAMIATVRRDSASTDPNAGKEADDEKVRQSQADASIDKLENKEDEETGTQEEFQDRGRERKKKRRQPMDPREQCIAASFFAPHSR